MNLTSYFQRVDKCKCKKGRCKASSDCEGCWYCGNNCIHGGVDRRKQLLQLFDICSNSCGDNARPCDVVDCVCDCKIHCVLHCDFDSINRNSNRQKRAISETTNARIREVVNEVENKQEIENKNENMLPTNYDQPQRKKRKTIVRVAELLKNEQLAEQLKRIPKPKAGETFDSWYKDYFGTRISKLISRLIESATGRFSEQLLKHLVRNDMLLERKKYSKFDYSKNLEDALVKGAIISSYCSKSSEANRALKMVLSHLPERLRNQVVKKAREDEDWSVIGNNKQTGLQGRSWTAEAKRDYINLINSEGTLEKKTINRQSFDTGIVENAVDFILKDEYIQLLNCRARTTTLNYGKNKVKVTIPSIIRTVGKNKIWQDYYYEKTGEEFPKNRQNVKKAKEFNMVGRSSFFTLLEEITTKQTKRHTGQDNYGWQFGKKNFKALLDILDVLDTKYQVNSEWVSKTKKRVIAFEEFMKKDYHKHVISDIKDSNEVVVAHNPEYALLGRNIEVNQLMKPCRNCLDGVLIIDEIYLKAREEMNNIEVLNCLKEKLDQGKEGLRVYMGHCFRSKVQSTRIVNHILGIKKGQMHMLCDFKMKIQPNMFSEAQSLWFSKFGMNVHAIVLIWLRDDISSEEEMLTRDDLQQIMDATDVGKLTKTNKFNVQYLIQVIDNECGQDAPEALACIQSAMKTFKSSEEKNLYGEITSVSIQSDNAPTYSSKFMISMIAMLNAINPEFHIPVERWIFTETGLGKTLLDKIFELVSMMISRYLDIPDNATCIAAHVAQACAGIRNTAVYLLRFEKDTVVEQIIEKKVKVKKKKATTRGETEIIRMCTYCTRPRVISDESNFNDILKGIKKFREWKFVTPDDLKNHFRRFEWTVDDGIRFIKNLLLNPSNNDNYTLKVQAFRHSVFKFEESENGFKEMENSDLNEGEFRIIFDGKKSKALANLLLKYEPYGDTGISQTLIYFDSSGVNTSRYDNSKKGELCNLCEKLQVNLDRHHNPEEGVYCPQYRFSTFSSNQTTNLLTYALLYSMKKMDTLWEIQDDMSTTIVSDQLENPQIRNLDHDNILNDFKPKWADHSKRNYSLDSNPLVLQFIKDTARRDFKEVKRLRMHRCVQLLYSAKDQYGFPRFMPIELPQCTTITSALVKLEEKHHKELACEYNDSKNNDNNVSSQEEKETGTSPGVFEAVYNGTSLGATDDASINLTDETIKNVVQVQDEQCVHCNAICDEDDPKQCKKCPDSYLCNECFNKCRYCNNCIQTFGIRTGKRRFKQ